MTFIGYEQVESFTKSFFNEFLAQLKEARRVVHEIAAFHIFKSNLPLKIQKTLLFLKST